MTILLLLIIRLGPFRQVRVRWSFESTNVVHALGRAATEIAMAVALQISEKDRLEKIG